MHFDRSRITSYLAIITKYKVIITQGAPDFKMAAFHFVEVMQEVISAIEERKRCYQDWRNTFQKIEMKVLLIQPIKSDKF